MEQRHIEVFKKLIETLKNYEGNLDMPNFLSISNEVKYYNNNINECGTSACVAGLIPLADKEFASNYIDDQGKYELSLMSEVLVNEIETDWEYIFSGNWGNNVQEAIERIETYLENGSAPIDFNEDWLGDEREHG